MLLWLFDQLAALSCPAALAKITLRAALAAAVSFALALVLGPRLIAWLRGRFREPNVSDSPTLRQLHHAKQSTPTMGGLFIVAGLVAGGLAFGDLANVYLQIALWLVVGLAAVGALDDLVKLRGRSGGLSPRMKLAGQWLVCLAAATFLYLHHRHLPDGLSLRVPLIEASLPLGMWFIPWVALVLVASSNSVNLADGLDGLAGGCLLFALGAMTLVVYATGHAQWAQYLHLPRLPGTGELTILAGATIGGLMGFLWFNCHPAQVFMGDTGSLPLGGLLGLLAVATRQELLLVAVGGVFVAEALSVIVQVASFRWRGRRVFLCAPLHHHFQFKGWPEGRIVVRFWIAAALCALVGIASLKLNIQDSPATQPFPLAANATVQR